MKITKNDLQKINHLIKEAESKTSGEIVPVILTKSDDYLYTHYLCALLFTFIGTFIITNGSATKLPSPPIILITIMAITGYIIPFHPYIKRLLLTKKEIEEEVNQKALQTFFSNKLHHTKDATGILIFISILERRVQILGDHGINKKVDQAFWDDEVNKLSKSIKNNQIVEGLSQVISILGDKLSEHFPVQPNDTDELKNDLVTDLKIE